MLPRPAYPGVEFYCHHHSPCSGTGKEYPPDEALGTQVVPAASKTTHQGVKVLGVTEVKQGQLEAAMERVQNALAMFLNIPGFEYSIDIYATAAEAMATIGMKP